MNLVDHVKDGWNRVSVPAIRNSIISGYGPLAEEFVTNNGTEAYRFTAGGKIITVSLTIEDE